MQHRTDKIEQARNNIAETEQKILRQRRRVEKLLVERHPADEAQAQLLIMEQSLIAMTRFLTKLERDLKLEQEGGARPAAAKRKSGAPEPQ
jgi:septal ring factor EnvC (AmiA/AmiB activator)